MTGQPADQAPPESDSKVITPIERWGEVRLPVPPKLPAPAPVPGSDQEIETGEPSTFDKFLRKVMEIFAPPDDSLPAEVPPEAPDPGGSAGKGPDIEIKMPASSEAEIDPDLIQNRSELLYLMTVLLAGVGWYLRHSNHKNNRASGAETEENLSSVPVEKISREAENELSRKLVHALQVFIPDYMEFIKGIQASAQEASTAMGHYLMEQIGSNGGGSDDLSTVVQRDFTGPLSRGFVRLSYLFARLPDIEQDTRKFTDDLARTYLAGAIDDAELYRRLADYARTTLSDQIAKSRRRWQTHLKDKLFNFEEKGGALRLAIQRVLKNPDNSSIEIQARESLKTIWEVLNLPGVKPIHSYVSRLENPDTLERLAAFEAGVHDEDLSPSIDARAVALAEGLTLYFEKQLKALFPQEARVSQRLRKGFEPYFALLLLDGVAKKNGKVLQKVDFYKKVIDLAIEQAQQVHYDLNATILLGIKSFLTSMKYVKIETASIGTLLAIQDMAPEPQPAPETPETVAPSSEKTSGDVTRAPPVRHFWKDVLILLGMGGLSQFFGLDGDTTFLVSGVAPFIYRMSTTISYFLHEVTHFVSAGRKSWTLNNLAGNISPKEWMWMLIPYAGSTPREIYVEKKDGSVFSFLEKLPAVILSFVLFGYSFDLARSTYINGEQLRALLSFPVVLGTLMVFLGALKTDVWDTLRGLGDKARAYCGVIAVFAKRRPGDNAIVNENLGRVVEFMAEVTKIRGRQQAGIRTQVNSGGKVYWLDARKVNSKRGNLPAAMAKKWRRGILFSKLFKFARPASDLYTTIIAHYRYSTSSAPRNEEGQPVQFEVDRGVELTTLSGGRFVDRGENAARTVAANGDFDYYKIYGTSIQQDEAEFQFQMHGQSWNNEQIGWWLERVLNTPHNLGGDTPKLGGMMDFLITQGVWDAAVRYAFYTRLVDDFKWVFGGVNPSKKGNSQALTPEQIAAAADVFRKNFKEIRDALLSNDVKTLSDIWIGPDAVFSDPEVSDNKRDMLARRHARLKTLENDIFDRLQGIDHINGWGEAKIREFVRATIEAFLTHDEFWAVREFLNNSKGSFGMAVATTLNTEGFVVAADGQPLAIGWNEDGSVHLVASEPSALKVPLDQKNGEYLAKMIQLDQTPGKGEIVRIGPEGIEIFSRRYNRFLTQQELAEQKRIEPLHDKVNPYDDPLPDLNDKDPVGSDIRRIPGVLRKIRDSWKSRESYNNQTVDELGRMLLVKKYEKRIKERSPEYQTIRSHFSIFADGLVDRIGSALDAMVEQLGPGQGFKDKDILKKSLARLKSYFENALYQVFARDDLNSMIHNRAEQLTDDLIEGNLIPSEVEDHINKFVTDELSPEIETKLRESLTAVRETVGRGLVDIAYQTAINVKAVADFGEADTGSGFRSAVEAFVDSVKTELFKKSHIVSGMPAYEEEVDVVITGIEVSLWTSEGFAKDLAENFPGLKIVVESANKLLIDPYSQGINDRTIVLAVSQSGQTFPTLNVVQAYQELAPLNRRVFVLTGEWKTLMGYAVGQKYGLGSDGTYAEFSKRIISNLSGFRFSEPPSLTVDATHATLTQVLLQLAKRFRELYPDEDPLGMDLTDKEIEALEGMVDEQIDEAERLTGVSVDDNPVASAENTALEKEARRWGWDVLDVPVKTLAARFNLYVILPLIAMLGVVGTVSLLFSPITTAVSALGIAGLIFAVYYDAFPYAVVYLLRWAQGRTVLDRVTNRTVVINDVPWVHQALTQFLSKMNSLSYAGTAISVFGGNPADHALHRYGHRIVRGVLMFLGIPDQRLSRLANAAAAASMTGKQGRGVKNFGVGTYVDGFGRERDPNPNAESVQMTIFGKPATDNPRLMKLYENRFDSLSRLIAGQVFFYTMYKFIVTLNLRDWLSQFWFWKHPFHSSQSGTVIATTASPKSARPTAELEKEKNQRFPFRQVVMETKAGDSGESVMVASPLQETPAVVSRAEEAVSSPLTGDEQKQPSLEAAAEPDKISNPGGIDLGRVDHKMNVKRETTPPPFRLPAGIGEDMKIFQNLDHLPPDMYQPFILDIQIIPNINVFLGITKNMEENEPQPVQTSWAYPARLELFLQDPRAARLSASAARRLGSAFALRA